MFVYLFFHSAEIDGTYGDSEGPKENNSKQRYALSSLSCFVDLASLDFFDWLFTVADFLENS